MPDNEPQLASSQGERTARQRIFSDRAWRCIELSAADARVGARPGRTSFKVCLRNRSQEVLDPEREQHVAISYKLLDEHGEVIERVNPRSPLQTAVLAGESVDLSVKLVIPLDLPRPAVKVRFSVMVEKRFWLFRLHPGHALDIPVVPASRNKSPYSSSEDLTANPEAPAPAVADIAQYCEVTAEPPRIPRPLAFACGAYSPQIGEQFTIKGRALSLGVYAAEGLMVVGSCGIQKDGQRLSCAPAGIFAAVLPDYRVPDHILHVAGTSVLFGPGYWNWGHWLIDHLPKLYLLQTTGWNLSRLSYLLPMDTPVWVDRLLMKIGIRADQLVRYTDAVSADELLIPTKIRHLHVFSPLLADVQQFLLTQLTPSLDRSLNYDRIYLSRRLGKINREMRRESEIEALARKAGFRVLQPEKLPLEHQLAMFRHAKVIGGEYGSALHGSLFSETKPIVFGLKGTWPQPGFVQSGIGDVLDQPTGYIFGESTSRRVFTVEPADFCEALDIIDSRTS